MENKPTSKLCDGCHMWYETVNEEHHKLVCLARSRIKICVYCQWCGADIDVKEYIYSPTLIELPKPPTIHGKMACDKCLEKAAKFLWESRQKHE